MSVVTLARFLIGNRIAILDVATSKHGLVLGLLFVLSAGLAREYDGEDLWHEPWHLLIPLAASLGSSVALFLFVELAGWIRGVGHESIAARYRAFLQVFWMTAPLAWLYAIPFERFLSPKDAVAANLSLLGLVAAWRVLLIARAISVLYQVRFGAALVVVMLYADTIVLVVVSLAPKPVVEVMGGVRHTEDEMLIHSVVFTVGALAILSWLFWLAGAILVGLFQRWSFCLPPDVPRRSVHSSAWVLAGVSLAAWGIVLPYTQPEQQNRWHTERYLRQGELAEGVRFMSERTRQDFPPHWDVPPRIGYGESVPDILQVIAAAIDEDAAEWVKLLFIDKLLFHYPFSGPNYSGILNFRRMDDDELRRATALLASFPEGAGVAAKHRKWADNALNEDKDLTPRRRELIEEFLRLADQGKAARDGS